MATVKKTGEATPYVDTFSFRYAVEYAYDTTRDCESNGCDSICRCSRLTNLRVTDVSSISIDCIRLVKAGLLKSGKSSLKSYSPSEIEKYCLQRMFLHFGGFSVSGYNVHAAMSYYGEEVSEVCLNRESDFRASIDVMLSLPTDIEKIVHILSLEYGHIADIIKQCRHAHIDSLRFDVIDASQGAMMLRRQDSYSYALDDNSVLGVVFNGVLIDGNHRRLYRLSHPESFKKTMAKYIVLR